MRLNIIARISVLEICVDSGYTFECISILTKVQVFSYRDVLLNNHRTACWCPVTNKEWILTVKSPTKSEAIVWWFFIDSNFDYFYIYLHVYIFLFFNEIYFNLIPISDKHFSKIFLQKLIGSLFLLYINWKSIIFLCFIFYICYWVNNLNWIHENNLKQLFTWCN